MNKEIRTTSERPPSGGKAKRRAEFPNVKNYMSVFKKSVGIPSPVVGSKMEWASLPTNERTKADTERDANLSLPRLAFTMRETAAILGISYISVHRLLRRGLLKSSTALRHKLIPRVEIEKFLRTTMQV